MGLIMFVIIAVVVGQFVISPLRRKFTKPNFEGKLVWITGASSGLGEAMTKRFASLGASVILSARNVKELERVKSESKNPEKHMILPMDFSKPQDILKETDKFVKELEQQGKKLDIVIENAGVSQRSLFAETDFENIEYIDKLNYLGPVAHAKAYISHMVKNKNGQIVIISSTAGLINPSYRSAYSASKAAIVAFFNSVRAENKDDGISVTNIFPGYIQTNVSKNALAGKAGETLGKTDANIENGLTTDQFCDQALHGIYVKDLEVIITDDIKQVIAAKIKHIFPGFVAKGVYKNLKQQQEALKKAQ
ncbi:hypothetical protein PPERSA_04050 [Pseudocohnilembus persalinus]|uniref:Short-chain dehydrogenase/reductase SDR n=1 Tax=Pseudocohnilembus persalinus TaxID=266149 RepID=A0A0V0QKP5_PSEPJ|nr:hypothetical protein PPERSA_04050 [Pseudocohnilembus persalinus]|eukprot:KRX02847.1 hypothetical protein PPERSA_04050 [Pseudocohnilembus persalinus]